MSSPSTSAKTPNGRKTVLLGIILVVILSMIGSATAWIMYRMIKAAPEPKLSPDRTMLLVESITDSGGNPDTHMRVKVEIQDATTRVPLFSRQTKASALRKWDTNWMSNDRVTLYSTEVGRLTWTRSPEGQWIDDPSNGDNVVPPVSSTTKP